VTAAVNRALDQRLPDAVATAVAEALEEGSLTDEDIDDVFGA
jgi:formaldehyde-activating enzyme involved in methanogenesis